jgi:hypothetical protein
MRVLFADDQIPHADTAQNERYKAELQREVGARMEDFERAFQEDFRWFTDLVHYLTVDAGLVLLPHQSFDRAKIAASERETYDIAVVDLSWNGDPGLPPNKRKNVGLEIIRRISSENLASGTYKPVIAFSQNFASDPELFAQVLEADALPVPKDYSPTGHRTLAAAVKLLGRAANTPKAAKSPDWDKLSVGQAVATLKPSQLWSLLGAMVGSLSAVAGFAYWLGTKLK